MDKELLKRLAIQVAIGAAVAWFGAEWLNKVGVHFPWDLIAILAVCVAFAYFATKKEQEDQEAAVTAVAENFIEVVEATKRRCKEAEERATKAEERYKKVVRQAQSLLKQRNNNGLRKD